MAIHQAGRRSLLAAAPLLAMPWIARASTRRLRIAHVASTDSVLQAAAVGFDRALKRATSGRLALEVIPNGQAGGETALIAALRDQSLDMAVCFLGPLAALAREIALVEIPYLFPDSSHARAALDDELGRHCSSIVAAAGLHVLAWGELGQRHMTANRPIRTPADLRGLKLRVPLAELLLVSFRAMGADAASLPFAELPEALRSNRFEAQENPVNLVLAAKLFEVQSHLSLTGHMYAPLGLCIAPAVLRDLPETDRELLHAAAAAGAAASRAHAERLEFDGLQRLRRAGMTVVDDVDIGALRRVALDAQSALSQSFGADAVARIRGLAAS